MLLKSNALSFMDVVGPTMGKMGFSEYVENISYLSGESKSELLADPTLHIEFELTGWMTRNFDYLKSSVLTSKSFICYYSNEALEKTPEFLEEEVHQILESAPFDNIWLQFYNDKGAYPFMELGKDGTLITAMHWVEDSGVGYVWHDPHSRRDFYSFSPIYLSDFEKHYYTLLATGSNTTAKIINRAEAVFLVFLNLLQHPETKAYKEQSSLHLRTKINNEIVKKNVSEITYIKDQGEKAIVSPSTGKTIEYSHSFGVRGHWRTISPYRIGKDRNGIRSTPGKTWVVEHIRGDGDFIEKTRVITNQTENIGDSHAVG